MITLYLLEKTSYVPLNLVESIKNPARKKTVLINNLKPKFVATFG